jgi:hypothetical protein
MTEQTAEQLSYSSLWRDRMNAAMLPSLPLERVLALAKDPYIIVQAAIARREDCPAAVIDEMSASPEWRLRAAIAHNPKLDQERIDAMSKDPAPDVVESLASGNPNLPPSLFLKFSSGSPSMRAAVARNPALPKEIMAFLSKDPNATVRQALASNPKANELAFTVLMSTRDAGVLEALAQNPNLPAFAMQRLATSPHARVRMMLANRDDLPVVISNCLRADSDSRVRGGIEWQSGYVESTLANQKVEEEIGIKL